MRGQAKARVGLFAAPETSPAVLFGLYDVLSTVGAVYPDMTTGVEGDASLDVRIVGADRAPFRCFGNVLIEPHISIDDPETYDVMIVCDLYTPITTVPRGRFTREAAWLRRLHSAGTLISSVCTGSLLLAEAGLLDGRVSAGHWAYADLYGSEYPNVTFDPSAILVLASESDGVITAGGVTAWQDLALHVIARLCGAEQAVQTAKVHLLTGHQDGQLPFAAMVRREDPNDAAIVRAQAWIADNYASPNPVAAMADQSGLQPRTFGRRFRSATGRRPIEYVNEIRVDEARRILESSSLAVDEVGSSVGYEDPTFFRRLFKRMTGLTPATYRRKFATIARHQGAPRLGVGTDLAAG
ncbi:MAG TPA: helix-turn-helix domain-containing protein [Candidatus Limnocylindrales bacterium]|nr:helix-turn-helix domain-containing protein [Candidatus Limnocylindrales bacterium]